MAAAVDSKKEQLPTHEVMMMGIERTPTDGVPAYAAMLALIKEASMPNCKVTQHGNTVFITHYGTGDNADLAVGRTINVDTAQNFILNGEKYFKELHSEGIRRFVAQFSQRSYATAFKQLERRPITTDQKIYVYTTPTGKTQVRIKLDGDIIERGEG